MSKLPKRHHIEVLFEQVTEDFMELIESKMYSVIETKSIDEFDGMVVISQRINKDLSIFLIYCSSDFSNYSVFLGHEKQRLLYKIEIKPAFYNYIPRSDIVSQHLLLTLDWWEDNQFDVDGGNSLYDTPPYFIETAMALWSDMHGEYNPKNWMWMK